jgi:hypothetical protein
MRQAAKACSVGVCGLVASITQWSSGASAVESGLSPYLRGSLASNYFDGSAEAIVRNGNLELGIDVTMNALILQATAVTEAKIFDGTFAFGPLVDYVPADLSATTSTPIIGSSFHSTPMGYATLLSFPSCALARGKLALDRGTAGPDPDGRLQFRQLQSRSRFRSSTTHGATKDGPAFSREAVALIFLG